ncbi:hypothetical protein ACHQM5_024501 [Ranunculus cassubicifolius]
MDNMRNSFKQIGSKVHTKISTAKGGDSVVEDYHKLISRDAMESSFGSSGRSDSILLKIDSNGNVSRDLELGVNGGDGVVVSSSNNNGSKLWRDSSYGFGEDNANNSNPSNGGGGDDNGFDFQLGQNRRIIREEEVEEDPPSKLIGQFLHKQKLSGDIALDMDLDMMELQTIAENPPNPPSPSANQQNSPVENRVSFQDHRSPLAEDNGLGGGGGGDTGIRSRNYSRQPSNLSSVDNGYSEVLRCTSNSSMGRKSGFLKTKTMKSRLMDSPIRDEPEKRSGRTPKSMQLKSGFLGRMSEEDEDDPFADEDLPDEFKKDKFNTLTVCQWVSLVLILAALVCSFAIKFFRHKRFWDLELWKWIFMVFVLASGRLISGWGIKLVVFFVERNFLLRKRVLYFVYGVRKAVQNCLWLGLVLIAWNYILDDKVKRETRSKTLPHTITKILVCLLVTTLLWLAKTLFVKVLASSFHVSTYFDRIQESLFNQYVIEKLSGSPLVEFQQNLEEDDKVRDEVQKLQNAGANMPADLKATLKNGGVIGSGGLPCPQVGKSARSSGCMSNKPQEEGIRIDQLNKLNQKNVSAWNMKRLMKIVRHGALSTLDEQLQDATEDDDSMQIKNEFEAKRAAKKIFQNVSRPGSKYIYLEDLQRFMKEDEALKTMSLFEGAADTKRVNKASLKNWVVNAFRERKALALTLDDTKTAVNQLHHMVNGVLGIIVVVIWLLILGIATTKLLLVVSSQLVLVAFMFGNTCKMVFEAIIFLFVMHPFDVGDRCEIEGVQMIVEEMNILTTVFLRFDNQKIIYPNSVLSTKPIHNYYRSPEMGDAIDFVIHLSTPPEKITLMKQRITDYVNKKTEHWQQSPLIVVRDVEDMNRLKISVWPAHTMNHQDMGERWVRRGLLVEEMIKIFRELDIEYRMLPVDVNMRQIPSSSTSPRLPSNWTTCA